VSIVETLRSVEVFAGLEEGQLGRIASLCRGGSYRQGATIFNEGDEALEFYVVTSGRVALEIDLRPVAERPVIPTTLEVVTEGEAFGWSAVVEPHTYTTSARCATTCSVLAIKGEMLLKAMDNDPQLGYRLMKKLAQVISLRLMHTRLRLVSGLGLAVLARELGESR